jgi:hypothetical protein
VLPGPCWSALQLEVIGNWSQGGGCAELPALNLERRQECAHRLTLLCAASEVVGAFVLSATCKWGRQYRKWNFDAAPKNNRGLASLFLFFADWRACYGNDGPEQQRSPIRRSPEEQAFAPSRWRTMRGPHRGHSVASHAAGESAGAVKFSSAIWQTVHRCGRAFTFHFKHAFQEDYVRRRLQ